MKTAKLIKNKYSKPHEIAKLINELMRRSSSKDYKKFKEIASEKDMEKFLRTKGLLKQLH